MLKTEFFDFQTHSIPYIIAEIGLNHNGDENLALRMIEEAARVGANAVKFQLYNTDYFIERSASLPSAIEGSLYDFFKQFELPKTSWIRLREFARKLKIDFLCSVFDRDSLLFYKTELQVPIVKVASTDLTNYLLLKNIQDLGFEMILSTGASEEQEVENTIQRFGKPMILMQCVSNYPSHPTEYNLSLLPFWKEKYDCLVGISDHCIDNKLSLASLFFGSSAIERHFTIDRKLPGPDQAISITPGQLRELKTGLETLQQSIGKPVKVPLPSEENARMFGRRSLFYKRDLQSGDVIQFEDLIDMRPGGGIPPEEYENIIGKTLIKNVKKGERVHFYDFA